MKQNRNILRGRPWLALLVLLAWLVPREAAATYVDETYNYQVMLNGANTIRITVPVYDQEDEDTYILNGYLYVKWKDKNNAEHSKTVLHWSRESSVAQKESTVPIYFETSADGSFNVIQGNSNAQFTMTKDDGVLERTIYRNNDGHSYNTTVIWRLPFDMLGSTLEFSWDVDRTGVGTRKHEKVSGLNNTTVTVPPAADILSPQVTIPVISFSEVGKLEVPWFMGSNNVTSAYYEYLDHNGKTIKQDLPSGANNGTIYLDATVPHKNFRVVVSYLNETKYPIENVSSNTQDAQMIHVPVGLTAQPTGDLKASVRLDWHVQFPETEDVISTDAFEIQRSLTGKEEDFVTIYSMPYFYDDYQENFTYIDSTLVEAISERQLKNGGTLDSLTYRVRRAAAQTWGWNNHCAPSSRCVMDNIHLLHISDYTADWEDERGYTARVSWNYADEYNAVWDNRAKMMMRVTMTNKAGETVSVQTYELNAQEREQRYKIIDIPRTCVDYNVEVFVDQGKSPLQQGSEVTPFFFPIRNAGDWHKFAVMINEGRNASDVNARLYADIEVSEHVGVNPGAYYRGTFDGNGHKLTFNKSGWTEQYMAPFRYVGNAIIRNLHTAGTIETSGQYAGGLVAYVVDGSNVTIENCRSSVTINSSSFTNGGFVSRLGENSNLVINTSKFDGSFEGKESHHNGGFVGYCQDNSSLAIVNSLFAPDHISTAFASCETWARGSSTAHISVINSYAASEYSPYIVIRDAQDWHKFFEMVNNAAGQYDVNALLDADITVSECVGVTDVAAFRGTFDGNGHTLNVNIDRPESCAAPFRFVTGNATIKNLHVTGTVRGGIHASGLIGSPVGSPTINIEKVWVSADVTSTSTHAAGILGHAGAADVYITDTRFDGKLTTVSGDDTFSAPIIGWGGEGGWTMHRVYNCGTFANTKWIFFCIDTQPGSATSWGTNSKSSCTVTSNGWSNVNYYNKTDQNEVMNLMNGEQAGSWHIVDGKAVPVMQAEVINNSSQDQLLNYGGWAKEGNTINPVVMSKEEEQYTNSTTTTANLPDHHFYHEGNGVISQTLMTETRQSSVVLTWDVDGVVDYYQVYRRKAGSNDNWDLIADEIDKTGYEDKTVSPLNNYEYKVRAVTDCEGTHYSETDMAQGSCKHTGRVEGYVRLNDGTGVPEIYVTVSHSKNTAVAGDESVSKTVMTDEKGYFIVDELPYNGMSEISYTVNPEARDGVSFDAPNSYDVSFNDEHNSRVLRDFVINSSYRFSGFVMYEGTSIPVKGARFKVDGYDVHNASGGFVETEYDGSFSFRVLSGKRSIQAVMDNHQFVGNGYFISPEKQNITEDKAGIYFYDDTKVKLIGRVVGGDDQGRMPLDNNISKNNLGNNLTMVMTLEGDNTSWLVYDNLNPELKTRTLTFPHEHGNGHQTTVEVERKRMTVKPDSLTGEFTLKLPPVRWKVQQVYCDGYPTLFQEGQVSEVVDLTDCLIEKDTTYVGTFTDIDDNSVYRPKAKYNAIYNRIYHNPVEITYRQVGYDAFDYFGDKTYVASTLGGTRVNVPLAYADSEDASKAVYTFGYPVFSLSRKYPIEISVVERYPWNGVKGSPNTDLVRIGGGKVTVHNGMKKGLTPETVELDSLGQGYYYLTADQTVRLLTGEDALYTVSMTLEQGGVTYEAEPLRGYMLNMFPISSARDMLVNGTPQLFDILRDPPGGASTATLAKGSTLKYSYMLDMVMQAGIQLNFGSGYKQETFAGVVAAPEGAGSVNGVINGSQYEKMSPIEICFNMEGKRAFDYTMHVNEDITTSSEPTMVGADADLYIGAVQNLWVQNLSTIRAIPDSIYQQMLGKLGGGTMEGVSNKYGTLVEIAQGYDAQKNLYHLVRDESIGYGPKVMSHFIHSQKHILTQLIPDKVKELRALMFTGTKEQAQLQANATGKPVYWSKLPATDEKFGLEYEMVTPTGNDSFSDEVQEIYQVIYAWVQMVAQNEREKMGDTSTLEHVKNFDVDGGTKLNYGEQFDSRYSITNYYQIPMVKSGKYFDDGISDSALGFTSVIGIPIAKAILEGVFRKYVDTNATPMGVMPLPSDSQKSSQKAFNQYIYFAGSTFTFSALPILSYAVKDYATEDRAYSRKESFNIVMDKKSHLNFDVYRVQTDTTLVQGNDVLDVFTNQNFTDMTNYVEQHIQNGINMQNARYARGFVYRTRGGATVNPWENERRSLFYNEGYILDERTKKVQNPKISLDRQSISGVAMGDPARFKVYLTNDSEQPEAADGSISIYNFYLDENSNPNGAKVMVDGIALTSTGWDMALTPGQVTQKTIEVYAGDSFDYEGLKIGIKSKTDWEHIDEKVAFDVHYLHQAGPVTISSPSDKWVLNTNAEEDAKRGWYIPVTIDGFNKHQQNFDHIEFQYKETLRGEDAWTNLCSYYADSLLMEKASGEREMIPENGNIITNFYGEGIVMEKAFDLRAVLYCRNGNSFLTTSSKVISGVKDTRRPQLFGTPEPKSGVLTAGENIVFNFSEDIEYNYLQATTNFEVKGEVDNDNVTETVTLQFTNQASVETEAQRNFSGKDLTIDMMVLPDETGLDMPLFSHGTNGKKLQLWLTKDFKLKAVVDSHEYVSNDTIERGIFTQVAMTINHADSVLQFYNGGVSIGKAKLVEPYNGTGKLIFGRTNETDRSESTFYQGRMMEARLWYRVMDGGLIGSTYGSKRLTGYEMGLVDYYPMNEGTGEYALDKTQGANARLIGASWAMPRGFSLRLDNDTHGLELSEDAITCTKEQDYTLMFWFKTDFEGRGVLVSNGAGTKEELGAKNIFNIAFEAEKLMYRTNGMAVHVPGDYSDNQWHHFAMTVNRAFNVANIYIDQTLRSTFTTDSIGGISGGKPYIGAAKYKIERDGDVAIIDNRNWLTGYIDELCFFEQALPLTLIKSYATKSPNGDELGLLTYLSFDRQERQKDNRIVLVAYPYSRRIYKDVYGNLLYQLDPLTQTPTNTPKRDFLFVDADTLIMKLITDETAAPVKPYEELTNLNFSFVGEGHKLLVNLNENNARLNRRNVYVTVRDVEDKRGNAMASPVTACYYVTNSSLEWLINKLSVTWNHNSENEPIPLIFYNNSSVSHTYKIENCPKWLTLDKYSDVLSPQDIVGIEATVSKDLNVGTYNEILYLTDEEGISEPFYLNITVEADQPDWAGNVSGDLLQYSMNISGQVFINDEIDIDANDIVGVFDKENVCHGFAHIDYSALTGESGLYLTVYDNQDDGRELNFKLWQYSTGRELQLMVDGQPTLKFQKSAILGTDTPVRFTGGDLYVQTFDLKKGWNWISFNVMSESLFNLNTLLDNQSWKDGDVLTDLNSDLTLLYTNGHWLLSDSIAQIKLSPKNAYAIKVQNDILFPVAGRIIEAEDLRTIKLNEGWNGIGYTPMMNLTVEAALTDYYDKAEPGDVIKSHDEFAYYTMSNGVGRWRGSLQYMKPGVGYMFLRKAKSSTRFRYPFYEPGSTFLDEYATISTANHVAARGMTAPTTMTMSAVVDGFQTVEGDRLVAYADGEVAGEAIVHGSGAESLSADAEDMEPIYISIASEKRQSLWFAIERNGEIVAATGEVMAYVPNAVVGTPDQPTHISFVHSEYELDQWYTVSGMRLGGKPTQKGVYIFNGKKVLVK